LRVCDIDLDRRRVDVRRIADDPGGLPAQDAPGDHGHASITTTLDLYPGEMDHYADRLNEAAGMSDTDDDAAKTRPDDDEDEQDEE
jgi:hypothetical protein